MVVLSFLAPLAKQSILKVLERITNGRLVLNVKATGEQFDFGDSKADAVVLTIIDEEKFWSRLGTQGDMGFADSYLLEEVKGDLYGFFKVSIISPLASTRNSSSPDHYPQQTHLYFSTPPHNFHRPRQLSRLFHSFPHALRRKRPRNRPPQHRRPL